MKPISPPSARRFTFSPGDVSFQLLPFTLRAAIYVMMNGAELLSEFRRKRSERAFADLVRRFDDLVFSVAMRRLNNAALAEEAAQTVFLRLAKSTPNIATEPELIGWLHRTTIHVAVDLWRSETRRHAREQKAAAMQSNDSNEHTSSLAVAVDEALDELSENDRQTLLLRFFDGRKMRELAEKLGITEDAAKMRVSRSLDRLRERLASKGIHTTSALLAAFLTEQAVTAAPAAVAQSILHSTAAVCVATSWIARIASGVKLKYAAILAGLAFVAIVFTSQSGGISQHSTEARESNANASTNTPTDTSLAEQPLDAATIAANPIQLLERVARARKRITSGKIAFNHVVELEENSVHGRAETNAIHGEMIFDGPRRRIEQIGYEYAYVGVGEAGEKNAQLIKEKKMSRAEAMRAGLLEQFEAHYVSAYDETAILEYRERGAHGSAVIRDPSHGSGLAGHFDPRCLGLRSFATGTPDSALSLNCADVVSLVGQEEVEGIPAWHIRVRCRDFDRNYWISVAQPDRLLRNAEYGDVYTSYYAPDRPRDPLPIKVLVQTRHGIQKFERTAGEYNFSVDPATFTLAGLGMLRGTSVVDERSMRSLGYWTGAGLSEELPPTQESSENSASPTLLEQVATLNMEPDTENGLNAAIWILLNTPDGPEVEKAGKTILDHHVENTNLLTLALRLERVRPRCAKELLTQLLAKNPDPETRGTACFSLAQTFMEEAEYGADAKATAEAKTYYQRFIREFSTAGKSAFDKKHKSAKAIEKIDRGFIGHEAPNFSAVTTTGEIVNTAETRGRAMLILFRSSSSKHDAEEYRKVYDKIADRDVTFMSVFTDRASDTNKIEDAVEASAPGWLIIRDSRAIFEAFYGDSWPSTVLVDKRGKISARDLRGEALEKAIIAATAP
jgi:RNA polymerase sigma factor (sigma-70 family)